MVTVPIENARQLSTAILKAMGALPEDIPGICDSMEYADIRGKTTHGMARLPLYYKNIKAGTLVPNANMKVVTDTSSVAVLDGNNGFGQVAGIKAARLGIEKAHQYGIAAVAVRNSNNFGAAGYFGKLCVDCGMLSIIMANAAPAFPPTGGEEPLFGTNPICFAAPGTQNEPAIVFDMAITNAARGKIRLAQKNGDRIPEGWALDSEGRPTTDPSAALHGSLLPIGGYKGYGLGLMVDVMAGLLSGSAYAGDVRPLSDLSLSSRNGHFFIVIDPNYLLDISSYEAAYDTLVARIRASGEKAILPGERGAKIAEDAEGTIRLSGAQYQEIKALSEQLGVSCKGLFDEH